MEGNFDIFLSGQAVGRVRVSREGLYYCFSARCSLSGDTVCRLTANGVSLGIPVPEGADFRLDTRKPVREFHGDWDFQIVPNRPVLEGRFVPIRPEEPFSYLSRLKQARLACREGEIGILVTD